MNELEPIEGRLQASINKEITGDLRVSTSGLMWASMAQVLEFAKLMAVSRVAVPPHLRNEPGVCLGIVTQAINWEMDPFAVANKSYAVDGRLAYEAQLINAVILRRAPINGRFKVAYSGETTGPKQIKVKRKDGEHPVWVTGGSRRCRVSATLVNGDILDYESPEIGMIEAQNSPLWKNDPDQQLFYYSSRAFCRRHFPDVLLGVYSRDELEDNMPQVAAAEPRMPKKSLAEAMQAIAETRPIPSHGNGQPEFDGTHDPETGEFAAVDAMDERTATVKLAGLLAARNGPVEFSKWWNRLPPPDVERIEPYMEEINAILAEKKP